MSFSFLQIARLLNALGIDKREQLYGYAKSQLGTKKSGLRASIDVGCAEAVNKVFSEAFGYEIGGDTSTARMYQALVSNSRFMRVKPLGPVYRGDIVISPTGSGSGKVANGHVGILDDNGKIMSNNSATGLWDEHLSKEDWIKRYVIEGGYPMYFFRIVI